VSGDRLKLEVREREDLGSRRTRRLRSQGLIPGVLYGKGHTRPIVVPERELRAAMTGASGLHAILDVVIEGQTTVHPSILADYQQDPLRGTISHIDLREVRLDQPIHATVAIQLVGEAAGVKTGGMISLVTREVQVEALPGDVPEHIDVLHAHSFLNTVENQSRAVVHADAVNDGTRAPGEECRGVCSMTVCRLPSASQVPSHP